MTELVSRLNVPDSLSWLDVDPASDLMYGISETKGEVYRMSLASDLASVTVLETTKLPGSGPAHLLVRLYTCTLSVHITGFVSGGQGGSPRLLCQLRERDLDSVKAGGGWTAGGRGQARDIPGGKLHQSPPSDPGQGRLAVGD